MPPRDPRTPAPGSSPIRPSGGSVRRGPIDFRTPIVPRRGPIDFRPQPTPPPRRGPSDFRTPVTPVRRGPFDFRRQPQVVGKSTLKRSTEKPGVSGVGVQARLVMPDEKSKLDPSEIPTPPRRGPLDFRTPVRTPVLSQGITPDIPSDVTTPDISSDVTTPQYLDGMTAAQEGLGIDRPRETQAAGLTDESLLYGPDIVQPVIEFFSPESRKKRGFLAQRNISGVRAPTLPETIIEDFSLKPAADALIGSFREMPKRMVEAKRRADEAHARATEILDESLQTIPPYVSNPIKTIFKWNNRIGRGWGGMGLEALRPWGEAVLESPAYVLYGAARWLLNKTVPDTWSNARASAVLEEYITTNNIADSEAKRLRDTLANPDHPERAQELETIRAGGFTLDEMHTAILNGRDNFEKLHPVEQIAFSLLAFKWDPLYLIGEVFTGIRNINALSKVATRTLTKLSNETLESTTRSLAKGEGFIESVIPATKIPFTKWSIPMTSISGIVRKTGDILNIPTLREIATLTKSARISAAAQEAAAMMVNWLSKGGSPADKLNILEALSKLDSPLGHAESLKTLGKYEIGERVATALDALVLPGAQAGKTLVDNLQSQSGLVTRVVNRKVFGGMEARREELVDLIEKAAGTGREAQVAREDFLSMYSRAAAEAMDFPEPEGIRKLTSGAFKYWNAVRGFYGRAYIGASLGVGTRNYTQNLRQGIYDHLDAAVPKGFFENKWREPIEAFGRTFGGRGRDVPEGKWKIDRFLWGFKLNDIAERFSALKPTFAGIQIPFSKYWRTGEASADIIGELSGRLPPELVSAIDDAGRTFTHPIEYDEFIKALQGGDILATIPADKIPDLFDSGALFDVQDVLKNASRTGNVEDVTLGLSALQTRIWNDAMETAKRTPIQTDSFESLLLEHLEELKKTLNLNPVSPEEITAIMEKAGINKFNLGARISRLTYTIKKIADKTVQDKFLTRVDKIRDHRGRLGSELGETSKQFVAMIRREGGGEEWAKYDFHRVMNEAWDRRMDELVALIDKETKAAEEALGRIAIHDPFPEGFVPVSGTEGMPLPEEIQALLERNPGKEPPAHIDVHDLPAQPVDIQAGRAPIALQLIKEVEDDVVRRWGTRFPELTSKQVSDLQSGVKKLKGRLGEVRTLGERLGTHLRDWMLHNYDAKYNADTVFGLPFLFPHWYFRTFAKWPVKALTTPDMMSQIYRLYNALHVENDKRPIWAQAELLLEDVFGLDISIPLMNQIEPMNALFEHRYVDADKLRTANGAMYETFYGMGLGGHPAIANTLAFIHYKNGNYDQALSYMGYLGSASRLLNSLTVLGHEAGMDFIPPGGVGPEMAIGALGTPYSLMLGVGADGSKRFYGTKWDQARIGKMLDEMAKDGELGPNGEELAIQAAYIALEPQKWVGDPAALPAFEAIDLALQKSRMREVPSRVGTFLGPLFNIKQEYEFELARMYEEANAIFESYDFDSPDFDSDGFRKEWVEFLAKNPGYLVVSMFRKRGDERLRAFFLSVMGRLPPGNTGTTMLESAGIPEGKVHEYKEQFWESGGTPPSGVDGQLWEASMAQLGFMLEMPDLPTATEWNNARTAIGNMYELMEESYPGTSELMDAYFGSDDKERFLRRHPDLEARLNEEAGIITNDPEMGPYYAGWHVARRYLVLQFEDKWDSRIVDLYADYKENFEADMPFEQRVIFLERGGFVEYKEARDEFYKGLDDAIREFGADMPDPIMPSLRKDAITEGITAGSVVAAQRELEERGGLFEEAEPITDVNAENRALLEKLEEESALEIEERERKKEAISGEGIEYWDGIRYDYVLPIIGQVGKENTTKAIETMVFLDQDDNPMTEWPVSSQGHAGLIRFVGDSEDITHALAEQRFSNANWLRHIGYIRSLPYEELAQLEQVGLGKLDDIEQVWKIANSWPVPAVKAFFDLVGIRKVTIQQDGSITLSEKDASIISVGPDVDQVLASIEQSATGQPTTGRFTTGQPTTGGRGRGRRTRQPRIRGRSRLKREEAPRQRRGRAAAPRQQGRAGTFVPGGVIQTDPLAGIPDNIRPLIENWLRLTTETLRTAYMRRHPEMQEWLKRLGYLDERPRWSSSGRVPVRGIRITQPRSGRTGLMG